MKNVCFNVKRYHYLSLLTIFIVKNSCYIARLSGKLSGMDDNSLNTLFP
jgi:hypothetical protein